MGQLKLFGEPPGNLDHSALLNLDYAKAGHTGFVASGGLAGGQSIIGGIGAAENLTLRSTSHATAGVVNIVDSLRLTAGIIQDNGGSPRIIMATASPHLTLTGDTQVASGVLSIGGSPSANSQLLVNPSLVGVSGTFYLIRLQPESANLTGTAFLYGLYGSASANIASGGNLTCRALAYISYGAGSGNIAELTGIWIRLGTAGFTGTLTDAYGIIVFMPYWLANKPTTSYGIRIQSPATSTAGVATAYSLYIDDIQAGATNKYLVQAGPSTPYLRLVGGAAPGVNLTNLYLNEGGTLRRVQVKDGGSIGAGDRVMVLV